MKSKKLICFIVGTLSVFQMQLSFAEEGEMKCADPEWISQSFDEEDRLNASLSQLCTFTYSTQRAMNKVYASFQNQTIGEFEDVTKPLPGVFHGLKGKSFGATLKTVEEGATDTMTGKLVIDSKEDLSSIESLFTSDSITGTGDGKYLKAFSEKVEITNDTFNKNLVFRVKLTQTILIEKPHIRFLPSIPDSIFKHEADKGILKDFDKESKTTFGLIQTILDGSDA